MVLFLKCLWRYLNVTERNVVTQNMAGQGTCVGSTFEDLRAIIDQVCGYSDIMFHL